MKPGHARTLSLRRSLNQGIRFTEHLDLEGIKPWIGSLGDACGNALIETLNGVNKAERVRVCCTDK